MQDTNKTIENNVRKIFRVIIENEVIFNDVEVYKHLPKIEAVNKYRNVLKMLQTDKPKIIGALNASNKYKYYTTVSIKQVKNYKKYIHNLIIEILVELLKNGDINAKDYTHYSQDLGNIKKQYDKVAYAQTIAKTFQMIENGEIEDIVVPFLPFKMNYGQFYLIVGQPGGCKTDLMVRISEYLVRTKQYFEYFNLEINDVKLFERFALTRGLGVEKKILDKHGNEYSKMYVSAADNIKASNEFLNYGNLYDINYNHIKQIENTIVKTSAKFILVDYIDFVDLGDRGSNLDAWKKADAVVRNLTYLAKKHNKIVFCIGVLNKIDGEPSIYSVAGGQNTRHDPDGILCLSPHEDGILMTTLKSRSSAIGKKTVHAFNRGTKKWGAVREEEQW